MLTAVFTEFLISTVHSSGGRNSYNKEQLGRLFLLGGLCPSVDRTISSNTSLRPSWVRAEHSRYLNALMDLAILVPSDLEMI